MKKEWQDPIIEKIDVEETALDGSPGDDTFDNFS